MVVVVVVVSNLFYVEIQFISFPTSLNSIICVCVCVCV